MARLGRGAPFRRRTPFIPAGAFTGTGSLSPSASIAGTGSATGSGAVSATASIAGSGSTNYVGTGSVSVTASIAGTAGGTGAGAVSATAAIAGTGSVSGTGAVSATASIAGSGGTRGTGSVSVTATIAGSAAGSFTGSGSLSPSASITGAGGGTGSGAVSASASIAGTGGGTGTGSVSASASIAGSGSLTTAYTGTGAVTVTAAVKGDWYFFNDAEEGTTGNNVGTGNSGGTGFTADGSLRLGSVGGSGALILDTAHVFEGSLSFKHTLDASGNDRVPSWTVSQVGNGITDRMSKVLFLPSLPSVALPIGVVFANTGTQAMCVQITSAGKIQVLGTTGSATTTGTTTVPTNSWFRVEWAILVGSATVGQVEARLFTNPYSSTPTETITSAANLNTTSGTLSTAAFGAFGLTGPASYSYWDDQYRLSRSTSYPPPPPNPAYSGTGAVSATASIAGSGVLGYTSSGSVSATATIAGSGSVPTPNSGAVSAFATVAGAGKVSDGGSLSVTATVAGSGNTTSSGSVGAVASITGTGSVIAVAYVPRTATSGSGNSQSISTTLPTGTAAGDLLICHLSVAQGGTAFTQPTISTPSGWQLIPSANANPLINQGPNAGIVGAWYYRWATGTDPAPSWTLNTGSTFFKNAWTIEAYSGGPGSGAPQGIFGSGATGGAAVTTNTTATTSMPSPSWYAETYSERSTTNTAYTNPAGLTRRAAVFGSGGAAVDILYVDSNGIASGTVGGDTATDGGTGSSWQTHGLILFPSSVFAAVSVNATISGSGFVTGTTTNSLNVTATITGNGTVTGLNPNLYVQQVAQPIYTLQLVDAPHLGTSSAVVGDLQMASQKSLVLNTPDASTLTWQMPGAHDESSLVGGAGIPGLWEMCTDAIIWRDDQLGNKVKLARLRVIAGSDAADNSGDSTTVTWNAADYKAVFASRLVLEGDKGTVSSGGLSFPASTDVASIAWDLVNANQTKTNGNMGITKSLDGWNGGGTANTGKSFGSTFIVTPGTDLKTALDTLLAGDTSTPAGAAGGFDWWIDEELKLHIKARNQVSPNPPGRGNASVFVADYHGTVRSFTRTPVIDQYANVVRADGSATPSTHTAPTIATDPYGRVERNITVSVNANQTSAQQDALVSQVSAQELYVQNLPAASYSLVLTQGSYDPKTLGVGDNVQVVISAGRLDINGLQRVLALQIDMSDDGAETVTLTTARPDVSNWVADKLAKLGARIKGLELRV